MNNNYILSPVTYTLIHYPSIVEEILTALGISPAVILKKMFQDKGVTWECTVGHMPDTPIVCCTFYDIEGNKDGRLSSGQECLHYGVRVLIRSRYYADVWEKIQDLSTKAEMVYNTEVMIGERSFVLKNVSLRESIGSAFAEDCKAMEVSFLLSVIEET